MLKELSEGFCTLFFLNASVFKFLNNTFITLLERSNSFLHLVALKSLIKLTNGLDLSPIGVFENWNKVSTVRVAKIS